MTTHYNLRKEEITLPQNWIELPLDDIAVIVMGQSPPSNTYNTAGIGLPFFQGKAEFSDIFPIVQKWCSQPTKIAEPYDILLSIRAPIGPTNIANEICCIGRGLAAIRYRPNYKYLYYFFKLIENELDNLGTGSTFKAISADVVKSIIVPLAPIEEQNRIVKKLDDLRNRINSFKEREIEIASLEDQAFNKFIYDNNDLYPSLKLGDYCVEKTKRIGARWEGMELIGVSNEVGITKLRTGGKESFDNYKIVQPGEFIYNPMRVDIGSIAIWNGNDTALTSPDYIVFAIEHTLSPLLVLKYLKSPLGLSEIKNNTQGSVRSRLYFKNLAKVDFPFCGEDGQKEAELILESFNKIQNESRLLQERMKMVWKDALKKAYSGQLVNHDSTAQSATNIVEQNRIEQERYKLEELSRKGIMKKRPIKGPTISEKSIIQILTDAEEPMTAKDVWLNSQYIKDIDGFYGELKKLIELDKTVVEVKAGNERYLKLAK